MLPATVDRLQPALAIMQSVTSLQARLLHEDAPNTAAGPAATPARDIKAVNDYYFGGHLTVTEAMTKLFEHVVGYLNDKLALGRDGAAMDAAAGDAWRDKALRDDIEINGKDDFSLPKPGENGFSFQRVSRMIQSAFNVDFLSQDRELKKLLEDMIGFRLDGMTVADLLEAMVDPGSEAAEKVKDVLNEGLAGQTGSKVSQRMERAASGPQSVEQAVAAALRPSIGEVDRETVAEDLEAIGNARAHQKLQQAARLPHDLAEALEEESPTDRPQGRGNVRIAAAVLQVLGSFGETDGSERAEGGEPATAVLGAALAAEGPDPAQGDERPAVTTLVKAYLETLEQEQDEREAREEHLSLVL
ncbi:hypothetical protein MesoLjLc_62780 [Mesorhizobium sp. L-8-10]|uniref:hypothetical protein n=1 Tax=Mesorhizobium sp. L-8-10 TaxID=2744523 RepID=UPI00192775B3|nr:hypothetical protein [Mesorhizobium sp. L-8-10]BCH34348.1 hypothetical protein MesoLjLc_62780 [Mesorhizobium sp. L-8-10]